MNSPHSRGFHEIMPSKYHDDDPALAQPHHQSSVERLNGTCARCGNAIAPLSDGSGYTHLQEGLKRCLIATPDVARSIADLQEEILHCVRTDYVDGLATHVRHLEHRIALLEKTAQS